MNGALPGLLDDPQWLSSFNGNVSGPDGSVSTQPHIAPLRNPAPSKGYNVLRPLEPVAEHNSSRSVTKLSPSDILSARESKNSHLAISQLVDTTGDGDSPSLHLANDNASLQLPSFVNLSVLEKSPVQSTSSLDNSYPNKRPRLEPEHVSSHDLNRTLPRPAQKNDMHIPSVPMLPAMVTGLHEPPPSAALLPSINADGAPHQAVKSSTKMQVKDILGETPKTPDVRPREPTSPSAEPPSSDPPKAPSLTTVVSNPEVISLTPPAKKEPKQRRVRRRWTDVETQHLIAGVKRHGMGKWKQILMDTDYVFQDRTSIDLKDRFRVFAKDYPELQNLHAAIQQRKSASPDRKTCDSDSKASSAGDHEQDDSSTALLQRHMSLKQRRKRHPWTQEEDSALLQGVTKHGFQWTDIHKDDDLKLGHRRATDLRDRIRNLYPDGYKQAEARPLRSELKRAEKAAAARKDSTSTPTPIPTTMRESTTSPTKPHAPQPSSSTNYNKGPSIADLTTVDYESDRPVQLHRSKTSMSDAAVLANADANGVTLPSLALGSSADTEEWDNTLPPFLGWDDTLAE